MSNRYFTDDPAGAASGYTHERVWYCGVCDGRGKYYKTTTMSGYPFTTLVEPCDACRGNGVKLVKSVKVRDQLL